jgi:nitrate/nitrite transporter NarK
MNQILKRADFYRPEDFEFIDVPNEAQRYQQKLSAGETLALPELERLNRLLLEAAYPKHIKKIYVAGWRPTMVVYGTLGIFVAAFFWFCLRDRPSEHPRVSAAELALIEQGRPPEATSPEGRVGAFPLRAVLASRSVWLVSAQQFFTNAGWAFIVTWMPRYFAERHQVPVELRGWMAFIPLAVGWFGMLLGGRLTDSLVRHVGLRWGRALPMSLTRFFAMAAYLFCLTDPASPWVAVAAFSVVTFSVDLGTASVWAFKQDVGGRYVASILGWGNMWGNIGAAIMARLLVTIMEDAQGVLYWPYAFLACAIAFFLSGVAALGVDARIPVVPKSEQRPAPQ